MTPILKYFCKNIIYLYFVKRNTCNIIIKLHIINIFNLFETQWYIIILKLYCYCYFEIRFKTALLIIERNPIIFWKKLCHISSEMRGTIGVLKKEIDLCSLFLSSLICNCIRNASKTYFLNKLCCVERKGCMSFPRVFFSIPYNSLYNSKV